LPPAPPAPLLLESPPQPLNRAALASTADKVKPQRRLTAAARGWFWLILEFRARVMNDFLSKASWPSCKLKVTFTVTINFKGRSSRPHRRS
jgi:hypothetical protein